MRPCTKDLAQVSYESGSHHSPVNLNEKWNDLDANDWQSDICLGNWQPCRNSSEHTQVLAVQEEEKDPLSHFISLHL